MFRNYFILLLLAHIIGDFYIQTNKMARKKEKEISWVLIHSLCYLAVMLIVTLPVMSVTLIVGVTIAAIFHCLIDVFKFIYISHIRKRGRFSLIIDRNVFFTDQILHSLVLLGISYWLANGNLPISLNIIFRNFLNVIGVPGKQIMSWLFAIFVIHKPTNIAISKFLLNYKPEDYNVKEDRKAGRYIGTVERIIMLIFIYINQYSAIGLVLTAKSIARYERITKEEHFAEYYLLGTLISTLIAIIVSFVF